ncbi:MAG TPA: ROK family protein, partial [Nocardioides sp.]|nr:ROK family protein [Nocardioides sp.]
GGRPAVLVEYAADRVLVAGIELGVGRTRVMVADALGTPLSVRDATPGGLRRRRPAAEVLDAVVAALLQEVAGFGGRDRLRAVGISVTGLVQPASGTCLLAPNLGWRDVPVARLVEERLATTGATVPVIVRGAAQASLIAEHREGSVVGEPDVVLLFEDEGIGAAVVEGGHLVEGVDGSAGELGHCAWPGATERCGCGRRGCVETLASGPAVRRAVEAATGHRFRRRAGVPTYAALADHSDDARVVTAVEHAGRVLGTAASWLTAITAPRVVVLSGALASAPPQLGAALAAVLQERALHGAPAKVVAGSLGADAALRGVVLLALDRSRAAVQEG